MRRTLERINCSKRCLCAVMLLLFAIIFYCNVNSWLVEDDFFYCFSWLTKERITNIKDIFPSMSAHRYIQNGRVIAHFLVQLFLMLPLWVFNFINSIFFVALVYIIYNLARHDRAHNLVVFLSVFGALWILQPKLSEVIFWLDGSINYLWSAFFSVVWLIPYVIEFTENKEMSAVMKRLFCVFSLFVGGYIENATVALVCMAAAFVVAEKICTGHIEIERLKWKICSVICMMPSFLWMLTAPAEIMNKSAGTSVHVLLNNFINISKQLFVQFWPILLFYAFLFAAAIGLKENKKDLCLSAVLFAGAMAAQYVLIFASACPDRCTFIVLILLDFACAVLVFENYEKAIRKIISAVLAVCLILTMYYGSVGILDIRVTSYKMKYNIAEINWAKENGENEVHIPIVHPKTKYSVGFEMPYLSDATPHNYTNRMMAKYFDIDLIYGFEFYK